MTLRYTIIRRAAAWLLFASAALGALSSCADDADCGSEVTPSVATDGGDVCVSFSIGGMVSGSGTRSASATRAGSDAGAGTRADSDTKTEAGDNNLNENAISRLDLYVFSGTEDDATLEKHVYCTYGSDTQTTTGSGTLTYSTTPDNKKCTGTWKETGLCWSEIKGKTVYIVANDSLGGSRSISALFDLKKITSSNTNFVPTDKQTTFLMDGKVENLALNTNVLKNTNDDGVIYEICKSVAEDGGGVELSRALTKIRLKVLGSDGTTDITTQSITKTDQTAGTQTDVSVRYNLVQYAKEASVIADGTDITATTILESKKDNMKESELPQQDGKIVFYTYPNNWYDSDKYMYVEEPINSDRQTYILLYAPYPITAKTTSTTGEDGTATTTTTVTATNDNYWYKVPVNYRLQQNNDEVNATVDDSLYKTQRNYIYDVTVTIDREGGTYSEPVVLKYQAQEWEDGKGGEVTFE